MIETLAIGDGSALLAGGLPAAGATPSVTVTGGSALLVLFAFVLLGVATVLSLLVTYRFAVGYRRSGSRRLLFLAVGLFLLTAAPTFLRLAFANLLFAPASYRVLATSATELLGLFAILHAIYR